MSAEAATGVEASIPPISWLIAENRVTVPEALAAMEGRVAGIRAGEAGEAVWLVEHPPSYTAGTSARADTSVHARASTSVRARVCAHVRAGAVRRRRCWRLGGGGRRRR